MARKKQNSWLKAPFPFYGSKRRRASEILSFLEPCEIYVEPFMGSLGVLLQSAPHRREIVGDVNGHIVNFWRALRAAPDEVAYWADYPTFQHDLTARHGWLLNWELDSKEKLDSDPDWYDPKAAGWWAWGMSMWVGGGFCTSNSVPDKRPFVGPTGGGQGVSPEHRALAQITESNTNIGTGQRLLSWMNLLADRLSRVIVLSGGWEKTVTKAVLARCATSPELHIGILLDPPYRTDTGRATDIYRGDLGATAIATASYDWAVAHGDTYRIAYCCQEDDFPVPDGWEFRVGKFSGPRAVKGKQDMIMYSPACKELTCAPTT